MSKDKKNKKEKDKKKISYLKTKTPSALRRPLKRLKAHKKQADAAP